MSNFKTTSGGGGASVYSTIKCRTCGFAHTTSLGGEDCQKEFNLRHKCIDHFEKQQALIDFVVKLRAFF